MASIIVPVLFENRGKKVKVRALVDTGAESTLLIDTDAKKLKLKPKGKIILRGAGGQVPVKWASVEKVSIPGSGCETDKMKVLIFNRRVFPAGGLTGLRAIVGLDFMQRAKVNIAAFARTNIIRCVRERMANVLSGIYK